ncbi:MAG: hypothetical protein HFI75_09250 [Lachnospiraceae bacterium]|nr:hypothetical protein [Lachnospiraceae bacterium]
MAIFQCKMCGANLNIDTKTKRVVCEYCGTAQSIYENDESIGGEAALLRRVFLALEDNEFQKAYALCDQALNINPESAYAYLGKLCVEFQLQRWENISECQYLVSNSKNYRRFMQFADDPIKTQIYEAAERNKENVYQLMVALMNHLHTVVTYRRMAQVFHTLGGYKDSELRMKECQTMSNRLLIVLVLITVIFLIVVFSW